MLFVESLDLRASISVESAGGNGFTTCCPLPSHVGTLRLVYNQITVRTQPLYRKTLRVQINFLCGVITY